MRLNTVRSCISLLLAILLVIVCFAVSPAYSEEKIIRILHFNDFHGFADPYKPYGSDEVLGGVVALVSKVQELRQEKPTLLFSAGDMIQGNNWANLFQGESVIELMNAMRFDAMVTGNHEFDFGQDILKRRLYEAKFPILAANVEGIDGLKAYLIREISGLKIAIIGVVTDETPQTTHPRNVVGLKFSAPEDAVRKYVNELRSSVDLIIVLSHLGHHAERLLAEKVEGIDLIVGGHSHTKVDRPVMIGKTAVVQAWEHGKALGVVDFVLADGKVSKIDGRLIDISPASGAVNKQVADIVEKYRKKVDAVLDEKIGVAEFDLDGQNTRKQETNLGNFIADIVRDTAGAEAAIIGGGSIRTSIKKGEIRAKHVYAVSPFNNYIVAIRLTGRQIREALEHGVSAINEDAGRFPQVSGIRFTFSRSAPVGSKVKDIFINGKPLDPEKEYVVATDDFLAAGGDGYKAFGEAVKSSRDFEIIGGAVKGEKLVYNNSGKWLRDVEIEHIRQMKVIAPKIEGRIIEVD